MAQRFGFDYSTLNYGRFIYGDLLQVCEEEYEAQFKADPILASYDLLIAILVIGVKGIFATKWFNEALYTATSLDQVRDVVRINLAYLRTMLTLNFKDFKSKNGRLYLKFSTWCIKNGLDLSTENMDKVTAFYTDLCANAKPRDANGHQAKTAISIISSVFWFDKLRVYQGWAGGRLSHERAPGDIIKTTLFQRFIEGYGAQLEAWRSKTIKTGAESRAKTRRLTEKEEEQVTKARRVTNSAITDRIVMRAGFMSIIGAPTLLRGNQLRDLRDSQLIIHELKNVGPAPCTPVAMTVTNTKTSRTSAHMENFVGMVRSSDRTACAVNFLASFKAYHHDVSIPLINQKIQIIHITTNMSKSCPPLLPLFTGGRGSYGADGYGPLPD